MLFTKSTFIFLGWFEPLQRAPVVERMTAFECCYLTWYLSRVREFVGKLNLFQTNVTLVDTRQWCPGRDTHKGGGVNAVDPGKDSRQLNGSLENWIRAKAKIKLQASLSISVLTYSSDVRHHNWRNGVSQMILLIKLVDSTPHNRDKTSNNSSLFSLFWCASNNSRILLLIGLSLV